MKKEGNKIGVQLSVSPESVKALGAIVMAILNCKNAEEETKRVALGVIERGSSINGTHISNGSINI